MASRLSFTKEDFSCPVCFDIFKDPVILPCSHSFCKVCLQDSWAQRRARECPVCRKRLRTTEPACNLALRNLCEAFSQDASQSASAGSEALCSLHGEQLKLFCLDDQQPVCLICRDAAHHTNHRFRPIGEAVQDHKNELESALKSLPGKLKVFKKVKERCDKMAEHIKVQAQQTEQKMREEFKKLHRFLQEEEEARVAALRGEERKKSQTMKENIEGLIREISTLSETISAIEEELRAEDISFLQTYKATLKRAQRTLPDPQLVSGALMDEAKHLGNLTFRVLDKMQDVVSYTPVILDPNTAHPELTISNDLTTVGWSRARRQLPHNPERFDTLARILGSEGFSSGTHRWDVEVGDNTSWALGVAAGSVRRKGDIMAGYWRVGFHKGKYNAHCPPRPFTNLPVTQRVRRIRVQLDCARGKLSFYDPDTNTHLHTFTHTFTERVFPLIGNGCPGSSLCILPVKVCLKTLQPS